MIALIDADIVAYRCSASVEKEPEDQEGKLFARINGMMEEILNATESNDDDFTSYISGENNFRYQLFPDYKANRKQVEPTYRQLAKAFILESWNGVITEGNEADDALGLNQTGGTVICSMDKDLLQIPGQHYNFVTRDFSHVNDLGGIRNFYTQLLVGDRADNILGVEGIGKKKAPLYLDGCETEVEMFQVVRDLYNDDERLLVTGKLLWIQRKDRIEWKFPTVVDAE